jgi:hypothetical protein
MVTVPADTPVTMPEVLIVATLVLLLLQLPPDTVDVSVIVRVAQTDDGPEMVPALGNGITVMP